MISLGGVVALKALRIGGHDLDLAIATAVRQSLDLVISEALAQELKHRVASANPAARPVVAEVHGRRTASGIPAVEQVSSGLVNRAIGDLVGSIVAGSAACLADAPPELAQDAIFEGIHLVGGGAQLDGFAERLKTAGYATCQAGKWHLAGTIQKPEAMKAETLALYPGHQGFDEYYTGPMNTYVASNDLKGNKYPDAPKLVTDKRFRTIWQTDAALSFIDRHSKGPFFIYLAYFTPHVPLESPEPWFSKTPPNLPLERRQALAMIATMDDGIGQIRAKLRAHGIEKNTLIFFEGDNGAPLHAGSWDGSLNLPMVGEKGMLTDGGTRTPFVAEWPGTLPAGKVYNAPVINLDIASTAVALAGLPHDPVLDGVNLIPFVTGEKTGNPHDALFWRWRSQAAIRADHWKLILLGDKEKFLFDLDQPDGESELAKNNLIEKHPEIAAELEKKLMAWNATLPPPGLPREIVHADQLFYDSHVTLTGPPARNGVSAPAGGKGKAGAGGGD